MPAGCRRMMASIPVSLDISSLTPPFAIYIPISLGDRNTDWIGIAWGRVDFGGSANGAGIAWKAYPANRTGLSPPSTFQIFQAGSFVISGAAYVAGGTGLYQWIEPWRQQDDLVLVIDVEGGSIPASSVLEFTLMGWDDQ